MHSLGKTVNELHAMLKLHEQTLNLPKNNAPALHAIRAGKVQKGKKHNKPQPQRLEGDKIKGMGKISTLMLPSPRFDHVVRLTLEDGDRPQYLASWQKEEKEPASLELVVVQGLRQVEKLKPGALSLNVGKWSTSIYTVSNKRAKLDLDSALLWHCRLGHISKKRIEKLQHDGLLNSTDLRALKMRSLYVW
ncbi:zinc finger, CCHC-type containing protein [Tanacetum coccineum]